MRYSIISNHQRAQAMRKLAVLTLRHIEQTKSREFSTLVIKEYYDAIHAYAECVAFHDGVMFKGDGSHRELLGYLCERMSMDISSCRFLQELREYRNRILYEGLELSNDFLDAHKKKITSIIGQIQIFLDVL